MYDLTITYKGGKIMRIDRVTFPVWQALIAQGAQITAVSPVVPF